MLVESIVKSFIGHLWKHVTCRFETACRGDLTVCKVFEYSNCENGVSEKGREAVNSSFSLDTYKVSDYQSVFISKARSSKYCMTIASRKLRDLKCIYVRDVCNRRVPSNEINIANRFSLKKEKRFERLMYDVIDVIPLY